MDLFDIFKKRKQNKEIEDASIYPLVLNDADKDLRVVLESLPSIFDETQGHLVEITEPSILARIDAIIPAASVAGANIAKAVGSTGETLYKVVLKNGGQLVDSRTIVGAKRAIAMGKNGIAEHANLLEVNPSELGKMANVGATVFSVRALNELIGDKERILEKLQSATVSEITDSCATAMNEVNVEIEKLQEQMMELLMKRNNGEVTDKEYEQQSQQVGIKIDQLLMRKEEILSEQGKVQLASYRIEEVTKLLQTGKILEEFDRVMFKSLVRKITVLSNKEIEIEFECGITVRETL